MQVILRTGGRMLAALAVAVFLFVDLSGADIAGVPWQLLAVAAFVVFAGVVSADVYSLEHQLHRQERQIDLVIRPDPPIDDWYKITTIEETRRHVVWAYFWIDMRNSDSVDRTVNEIYLELREARRWWGWPLLRPVMVTAAPVTIDYELDWHKRERPAQVDWVIPAGGPTVTHRLHLEHSWDSKKGKLPKWINVDLVIEVGGRSHKRRIDIEPFDEKKAS